MNLSEQHFQSDDENGPEDYYIEPPRTPSARRSSPAASPRFAADSEATSPARSLQSSMSPRSPRTALLDDDAESGDSTSWVGGNEREVKLTGGIAKAYMVQTLTLGTGGERLRLPAVAQGMVVGTQKESNADERAAGERRRVSVDTNDRPNAS